MTTKPEIDKHEEFYFGDGDLVLLVRARTATAWPPV